MPYVPVNVNTYCAAYSGALASIAASGKVPSPSDEPQIATAVQLWAQAFDTAWGLLGLNTFSQQAIFNLSAAVWQTRAPLTTVTLAQYTLMVSPLIAEIIAANLNFTAQGITPPPIPTATAPGGPNHAVQFDLAGVFTGDATFTFDPVAKSLTFAGFTFFAAGDPGTIPPAGSAFAWVDATTNVIAFRNAQNVTTSFGGPTTTNAY